MYNHCILKYFKKFISLMLIAVIVLSCMAFSGCGNKNFTLYFGVDTIPISIDPQKASSYSELLTVRNCFRGLIKQDNNGKYVCDVAESYTINDNYTEYYFKLKNTQWSNSQPVTAQDFVFAISRIADGETQSKSVNLITNIVGAQERLNGTNSILGVEAISDNELTFRLIKPDRNFLSKLTLAAFMPCNRDFFEDCKGKYGLDRKNILTNGNYTVTQWNAGKSIKLSLKQIPNSNFPIAQSVLISVSSQGKNNIRRIIDNEIGMTVDYANNYLDVNTAKYTVRTLYRKNFCIVFNPNSKIGSNAEITEAFAKSVHSELYSSRMSNRFKTANSIIPNDTVIFDTKVSNQTDNIKYGFKFDPENARQIFLNAILKINKNGFPKTSILTINNNEIKAVLNDVVSEWQATLGTYINITTTKSEQELLNRVFSGDYTIAFIPVSGTVYDILKTFNLSQSKNIGINDPKYDVLVKTLFETDDTQKAQQIINDCIQILSQTSSVIPIISVPTAYIYKSSYKNVVFSNIDETIDFSYIYKN